MKSVHPVRVPVYIKTDIISGDKKVAGVIGNFSMEGVFAETVPTRTAAPFMPGKSLSLEFKASPRSTIQLHCEVIWLYTKKTQPSRFLNSMGMKIINPPVKFRRYFNTL